MVTLGVKKAEILWLDKMLHKVVTFGNYEPL